MYDLTENDLQLLNQARQALAVNGGLSNEGRKIHLKAWELMNELIKDTRVLIHNGSSVFLSPIQGRDLERLRAGVLGKTRLTEEEARWYLAWLTLACTLTPE